MSTAGVATAVDLGGGGAGFPTELFTITGEPGAIEAAASAYGNYAAATAEIGPGVAGTTADSWTGDEGDLYRRRVAEYPPMMSTATLAFGEVCRSLQAFADTMSTQQAAMDRLREEAMKVWQQLQAARAAQASAVADVATAGQAVAALPATPAAAVDVATAMAGAVAAQQALASADARVSELEGRWEECLAQARRIKAVMTEAAAAAASRIGAVPRPGVVPPEARGGATGTTMGAPVSGSPLLPLEGGTSNSTPTTPGFPTSVPTLPGLFTLSGLPTPGPTLPGLPKPGPTLPGLPTPGPTLPGTSVGPAPATADAPESFVDGAARHIRDKLTSEKEWRKGLNIIANPDVPSEFSTVLPALGLASMLGGAAKLPNEIVHRARWFLTPPPGGRNVKGASAINPERLRLDRFMGRVGTAVDGSVRLVDRMAAAPTLAAHDLAQELTRLHPGARIGRVAPFEKALGLTTTMVVKQVQGMQKLPGRIATVRGLGSVIADVPTVKGLNVVSKVGSRVAVPLSVFTSGLEQWQKDASNPSMGGLERTGRIVTRGAIVGGTGWAGGALGGAAAGAAVGSVVPVVGTAVGGVVGGIVGGVAGSIAGDGIADAVMDKWDAWRGRR